MSEQQDVEWVAEDGTWIPGYATSENLVKSVLDSLWLGYVMTDWGAQHGGIASSNAGLDMVMPSSTLWNSNLTDAIANGTMEASRLDDMATR